MGETGGKDFIFAHPTAHVESLVAALVKMERSLAHAAGNFYINDKPTGAVVGQQPFGGSRASGTNEKAGSIFNMIRWTSPRVIKETFVPICDITYPYMEES